MASPENSSHIFPLLDLHPEIHLAILTHLQFFDFYSLRLVNQYFHATIPPPTHVELLSAESPDIDFLACVGCTRLRPRAQFSTKMCAKKKRPGKSEAHNRFCIECGRRPLPGTHRYHPGHRWEENGAPFVRCFECKKAAEAPAKQRVNLCISCHTQDLERKAAEELDRVQRLAREREERRFQGEERRMHWSEYDGGGVVSDFSESVSDEGEEQYDTVEDINSW